MKASLWHWHRLRAMGLPEMARHAQRKLLPLCAPPEHLPLKPANQFPGTLPKGEAFSPANWKAFGKLPIKVDDPPRWNYDYLAGVEVPRVENLNHRKLPGGADIKLIWELSRWYELAQLAQARDVKRCVAWLEDWIEKNPPYQGLNWTSALETGVRLIHFTWIDALLGGVGALRERILPAHARFTWKMRSFGSSANNHLLGELAGLIGALVRWPQLESLAAPLDRLQRHWEREVLAQFASDGGNQEQALGYHTFSLDLCQYACAALKAAGRKIAPEVQQRLAAAEEFFALMQVQGEPWDYGDSDDATIFGAARREPRSTPEDAWLYFGQSGMARYRSGPWDLRWDLSPLGYLSTAAHGHLDALHLSVWWNGMAVVIDPGTGAYYADTTLRNALASWETHNGPHLPGETCPKRLGTFLWSEHHAKPVWLQGCGEFTIPQGKFSRQVSAVDRGWRIEDRFEPHQPFVVRWQFAPGAEITLNGRNCWRLKRKETCFDIQVSGAIGQIGTAVVSPAFRQTDRAPFLELESGSEACALRTLFLSC